jgi:hypothetical protein
VPEGSVEVESSGLSAGVRGPVGCHCGIARRGDVWPMSGATGAGPDRLPRTARIVPRTA